MMDSTTTQPLQKEKIGMPYKSVAQMRFFHSKGAAAKGITPATVNEFDLPKRKAPPIKLKKRHA